MFISDGTMVRWFILRADNWNTNIVARVLVLRVANKFLFYYNIFYSIPFSVAWRVTETKQVVNLLLQNANLLYG